MTSIILNAGIPASLADMLRRAFGDCAAKNAARYADTSHRTVSDWLQRRAEPGAWKLLRMVRHPGFRAELRAYLDHIEMEEANIALRLQQIDAERLGGRARVPEPTGMAARPATVCPGAQGDGAARRAVGA